MKRRSMLLSLASALLSGLLVYGVYILQLRQVELQQTVNVVAPKDFVSAGTMLTGSLLEFKPVFVGSLQPGMYTRMDDVIGLEAVVPLGTDEPILNWKLDRLHLFPGTGESTFQIPHQYILSISNGIRAGDWVRVYVSGSEAGLGRLFERDISVASVKSANNVEVDNPKNSTLLSKADDDMEKMYISRLEANGAIDQINLNLTEEEWLKLDRLCSSGKEKLVIAYTVSGAGPKKRQIEEVPDEGGNVNP